MKTSAIIINYNQGRFFPQAYKSLYKQTVLPDEIIVIDDKSTDDSTDILSSTIASYEAKASSYIPTRLIEHEVNKGPSAARNTGINAATGEFLALLDCDDMYYPNKIESSLKYMDDPSFQLIYSDYDILHPDGSVKREYKHSFHTGLLKQQCLPNSNSIIRKSIFNQVGLFNEQIRGAEDYEMWTRIAQNGMIGHIPEPLFCYRLHGENFTIKNRNQVIQNTNLLRGQINGKN